jgi:hypothetical protein
MTAPHHIWLGTSLEDATPHRKNFVHSYGMKIMKNPIKGTRAGREVEGTYVRDAPDAGQDLVTIDMAGLTIAERHAVGAVALERSHLAAHDGLVRHAYSAWEVPRTDQCPQCQARTRQEYAHFIYATQRGARVLFAPAGHFCTDCPSVIVDEAMIRAGIADKRYTYRAVLGLDDGSGAKPDVFETWNGRRVVVLLDEDGRVVDMATDADSAAAVQLAAQNRRRRRRTRRYLTPQSRKSNRRR